MPPRAFRATPETGGRQAYEVDRNRELAQAAHEHFKSLCQVLSTLLAFVPDVQEIAVTCGRNIASTFVSSAIERRPNVFLAFL